MRPHARAFLAIAIAALFAVFGAAQAQAAPSFESAFTGADISPAPANPFNPGPSAVVESSGEVYVFDKANQEIDRFSAAGAFIPGSSNDGSGTTTGSFSLIGLGGLAVDQTSGNLYFAAENQNTVYAFSSAGTFLWQIDPSNFAPAQSWGICGIAVDSEGNPWVSEFNGQIRRFATTGSPPAQTGVVDTTARGNSCRIVFDSEDSLYVSYYNGGVDRYQKNPTPADPSRPYDLPPVAVQTASKPSSAVAVDLSTDDVYIDNGTEVAVYSSSGAPLSGTPFGAGTLVSSTDISINGSNGKIYLSDPGAKVELRGTVHIFNTGSAVPQQGLEVTKAGDGDGTVTSSPSGINCGATCANEFDEGSTVTLTATPDPHNSFSGWSGCDAEPSLTECEVVMSSARSVTAEFTPIPQIALEVQTSGSGTGTVISSPEGIECEPTCEAEFDEGAAVTLTATPNPHNEFSGWSGCDGEPSPTECELTMSEAKSVSAEFTAIPQKHLTVELSGPGAGQVVNVSPGFFEINCSNATPEEEASSICSLDFDEGALVTLIAFPPAHNRFLAWTDCPVEVEMFGFSACEVTMSDDATVGAEFEPIPQQGLDLTIAGAGSGEVTSDPEGIACASSCSASFDEGAAVTLTATPDPHNSFSGWSGDCESEPSPTECTLTMSEARAVSAGFEPIPQKELTVQPLGAGSGVIVNVSPGFFEIECSTGPTGTCSASFDEGTTVELAAVADEHNEFSGWSDCPEEVEILDFPGCVVVMDDDAAIGAEFTPITHSLEVSVSGQGSVSADSGAISGCTSAGGPNCSGDYDEASTVTLTASPSDHHRLASWGGACAGTPVAEPCEVEVNEAASASAAFAPITHTLALTKAGAGAGTVTSNPAGINCGATCSAPFDEAATVTLTATPAATSSFSGWSGPDAGSCGANPVCEVAIGTANAAIVAGFAQDKPAISGEEASGISQKAATLKGTVDPRGANVSACKFEYGTSADYGSVANCASLPGSGASPAPVSAALSGLSPNTTYHYRLVATNSGGTTNGADQTFTTLADTCATNAALCPPPAPPAPPAPSSAPAPTPNPPSAAKKKKPLKCKKGFKKKKVKGKQKCVKAKKPKAKGRR